MRFKFVRIARRDKGFTLIELLVVCAIIGIILALAIPNLFKARISANEANARKSMQTLRDAEGEFFEQDMNDDGKRNFTNLMGDLTTTDSLRCPNLASLEGCTEQGALVDNSFEGALATGTSPANSDCVDSKAGYCVGWTADAGPPDIAGADITDPDPLVSGILESDFGWEASMTSAFKNGRRDFGVWGDGVIRCTLSAQGTVGAPGLFDASRDNGDGACD